MKEFIKDYIILLLYYLDFVKLMVKVLNSAVKKKENVHLKHFRFLIYIFQLYWKIIYIKCW